MFTDIFHLASTATNSAAFEAGKVLGMIIGFIMLFGLPFVFILSLVKLISTKNKAWIVGLVLSSIPMVALACVFVVAFMSGFKGAMSKKPTGTVSSSRVGNVVKVKGTDLSLDLPSHWRELKDINDDASLSVGNLIREEYFIVLNEPKVDLAGNLQDFSNITCETIFSSLTKGTMSEPKNLTINGMPAIQRELSGTVDHIKVTYIHTSIEGKDQYYQLMGWTLPSRKTEVFKIFDKVVNSSKEEQVAVPAN